MLIVFGGLPGTGKTTIAGAVATELAATYLRVDTIEQSIRDAGVLAGAVGSAGYAVAQAVALANLSPGRFVVADAVNPVRASREGWRSAASTAMSGLLEVEVICSDLEEHERRVSTRVSDIPDLELPSWEQVQRTAFEPWDRSRLLIDTGVTSPVGAIALIIAQVAAARTNDIRSD